MASTKFTEILAQAAREGMLPNKNARSRQWFKDRVKGMNFSSWETYDEDRSAYLMDNILADGIRKGFKPGRNRPSRSYFRNAARNEGRIDGYKEIGQDNARFVPNLEIGNMYCFLYDAKHKDTLPYWDKFPLIFPAGPAKDGFYGVNFHYLPHATRAKLMDALYSIKTDKNFDMNTKIQLSYDVLISTSKFKWFKPAFKHYLYGHMESEFIFIPSAEWDAALFLDMAQWQKQPEGTVWADSNSKLGLKRPHKNRV